MPQAEFTEPVERVTTLELFFDLVFVFTITQLTTVLYRSPSATAVVQVVVMLTVIWWMYGGYAWLTNAVRADTAARRLEPGRGGDRRRGRRPRRRGSVRPLGRRRALRVAPAHAPAHRGEFRARAGPLRRAPRPRRHRGHRRVRRRHRP